MSSSPSLSLPSLPLEIHHEILRFCDPQTLGRTSQVSLPFLQLSGPLLCREVHIYGLWHLRRFFVTRMHTLHSQLGRSLSLLHSTVILHFDDQDVAWSQSSASPFLGTPLDLHRLEIHLSNPPADPPRLSGRLFFNLFNPVHLLLQAYPPATASVSFGSSYWPRLETLQAGLVCFNTPSLAPMASRNRLPRLSKLVLDYPVEEDVLHLVLDELPPLDGLKVEIRVGTEAGKEKVMVMVREIWKEGAYGGLTLEEVWHKIDVRAKLSEDQ